MKLSWLPSQSFAAFLFDMDGTLINSLASAERIWGRWASQHGLDVERFLPTIHGARTVETISKLNLPGLDAAAEAALITKAEIEDLAGVVEVPGAKAFVQSLPIGSWAIVTSAPRALALARLKAAGIPLPEIVITAEDVTHGKPDPEGFRLGAKKLKAEGKPFLVFEDTQIGVQAGHGAGGEVLLITATHGGKTPSSGCWALDYSGLKVAPDGAHFRLYS